MAHFAPRATTEITKVFDCSLFQKTGATTIGTAMRVAHTILRADNKVV